MKDFNAGELVHVSHHGNVVKVLEDESEGKKTKSSFVLVEVGDKSSWYPDYCVFPVLPPNTENLDSVTGIQVSLETLNLILKVGCGLPCVVRFHKKNGELRTLVGVLTNFTEEKKAVHVFDIENNGVRMFYTDTVVDLFLNATRYQLQKEEDADDE